MGWVNLLQSQLQLALVIPNINAKPQIRTFFFDVDDTPHIRMHLESIVLGLKVGCL